MTRHPPDHCQVHPLPSAPQFVRRKTELADLRALWQADTRGVIALVGLGGAGKTAIAARLLEEMLRTGQAMRPDGLFVWSFYQEPDVDYFLRKPTATSHATKVRRFLRKAQGCFAPLERCLDERRTSRSGSGRTGTCPEARERSTWDFRADEDPLLTRLLSRVAEGVWPIGRPGHESFSPGDLELFRDRGYRHLDIEGLSVAAARALLRYSAFRVMTELQKLVDSYGAMSSRSTILAD